MQRKYNSTNAQALAVYQALQQNVNLGATLDDEAPTGVYLSSNTQANGDLSLPPALLERLSKGFDKGAMGSMVLDPFCPYDYPDRRHIRNFSMSIPIPFSAFDGIRRSKHQVQLTTAQEENVLKSFDKLLNGEDSNISGGTNNGNGKKTGGSSSAPTVKGAREISVALPFVSAFFDQRCPELRNGVLTSSREGATYLLLSVITGHKELCAKCLKTGANPNNMSFLRDEAPASGDMFHGYSPVFMAVLAEQLEILDLLSSCGGSVHVYDRWGRTPLHAAMAMESVDTVQWLLGKGAPLYIPDGFGILPADSCVGNQFAEYSMPLLALQPPPTAPPLSYFAESSKSWASPEQEANKDRKENATNATASSPAAATTSFPDKTTPVKFDLCHCHSGRPVGYCGCVDDMLLRWSRDRLNAEWSPGVDFSVLAKKQAATEEERKRTAYNNTSGRGKA